MRFCGRLNAFRRPWRPNANLKVNRMTQNGPSDDVSVSEEVSTLEAEIAQFESRKIEVEEELRRLLKDENPAQGVFYHKEIFTGQQEKLRLAAEIDIRQRKINRLHLGVTWNSEAAQLAQRN